MALITLSVGDDYRAISEWTHPRLRKFVGELDEIRSPDSDPFRGKLLILSAITEPTVFIDSDCFAVRDSHELAEVPGLAMAKQAGFADLRHEFPDGIYNTGVVSTGPEFNHVFRYALGLYDAGERWYKDQYAVNLAVRDLDVPVTRIDDRYNMQCGLPGEATNIWHPCGKSPRVKLRHYAYVEHLERLATPGVH